ncbi:MAG TPA: TIGR02186 family protein [Azospirillaceae bacterium]|nr:TIGR02186 family protein [Azospirillaceae bacterium]HRQ80040.1 TIGR02186 family protein [Azospirillaceae bacterium]
MSRVRLIFAVALWCAGALAASARPASAQELIADLSSHLIAITTMFTGGEVVLFGAAQGPGEVAAVVTGPRGPVTVRMKDRTAGLWVNRKNVTYPAAPGYYAVASSAPLEKLAPRSVLDRHGLGVTHMRLEPARALPPEQAKEFRAALIRNKARQGLYQTDVAQVQFLGGGLFRVNIRFPADVPTGLYTVEVFLVQDGEVTGAQTTPLTVTKSGFSAEVYEFAVGQPEMYGFAAVTLALAAGWLAGLAFRGA